MARAAVINIYTQIMSTFEILNGKASSLCGEYADELIPTPVTDNDEPFFTGTLSSGNKQVDDTWKQVYLYVYACNDAIQGLTNNNAVTQGLRHQLLG
jgi:hypothetical protein